MKKLFLFVAAVAMSIAASATDIWTGSKHVSWDDGGIQIEAAKFATAQPGQKIVVTYSDASDGIEFKVMNPGRFDHIAGSRVAAWISGDGTFEQFLTKTAIDSLKLYGLEIIGANFTCTKVELNDGKVLQNGYTVWTGFFWADDWTTLELYRDGYCNVDLSQATALRIYSEANRSDFVINIKENWGEGGQIADQTAMTAGEGYMELPLTDDLRTRLANAGQWMIQFNKEAGAAFNVTDIVLVMPVQKYTLELYVNDTTMGSVTLVNAFKHTGPLDGYEGKTVYEVAEGDTVILSATANEGYEFKEWQYANELKDSINWAPVVDCYYCGVTTNPDELTFVMNGDIAVMAVFAAKGEGIEQTNANAKAVKSFRNGMLVIEKNGKFYNALGAEVK